MHIYHPYDHRRNYQFVPCTFTTMIIILTIIVIIIVIMISNTPAGVKKQAEGGSYPLYQLVNLNGDDHDGDFDDDDHGDGDGDGDDHDDQCFLTKVLSFSNQG